jgi:hypothetical protein
VAANNGPADIDLPTVDRKPSLFSNTAIHGPNADFIPAATRPVLDHDFDGDQYPAFSLLDNVMGFCIDDEWAKYYRLRWNDDNRETTVGHFYLDLNPDIHPRCLNVLPTFLDRKGRALKWGGIDTILGDDFLRSLHEVVIHPLNPTVSFARSWSSLASIHPPTGVEIPISGPTKVLPFV